MKDDEKLPRLGWARRFAIGGALATVAACGEVKRQALPPMHGGVEMLDAAGNAGVPATMSDADIKQYMLTLLDTAQMTIQDLMENEGPQPRFYPVDKVARVDLLDTIGKARRSVEENDYRRAFFLTNVALETMPIQSNPSYERSHGHLPETETPRRMLDDANRLFTWAMDTRFADRPSARR